MIGAGGPGRPEHDMVIASWILNVEPRDREAALAALAAVPEARLCGRTDPWVVTTECPDADLGRVQRALAALPGVFTVAMVVAYRDREEDPA